jgi:hypothetical protein
MDRASESQAGRWPLPVGVASFLYGVLYGSLYAGPQSFQKLTVWAAMEAAIAVALLIGGIGLIQHRPWSRYSLLLGSYLVLGKLLCLLGFLAFALSTSSGTPAEIRALVIVPVIVSVWPMFLVIWLWRPAIRSHIRVNWTREAVSGTS